MGSAQGSGFYARRLVSVEETSDVRKADPEGVPSGVVFACSSERMGELPDRSVALAVTSPPYHCGKDYDTDASFGEYLGMLGRVFAEVWRVLEPGGRAVVNVAGLGRRPYIPLPHHVGALMADAGFLARGEVVWRKPLTGSCAWGSWMSPANPVLRDVHEVCLCYSKGRFDRAGRGGAGDMTAAEFAAATQSVWDIRPESASRVGHPAPFPVELPRRFIRLYTWPGELVLDPFMGSGTTAVAAEETGRRWVGYETDAGYRELAARRLAQQTLPVLDGTARVLSG